MEPRPNSKTCPPAFALERLRLGEPGASEVWRAHVDGCPHCQERLASLAADERAFKLDADTARIRQTLAAEEERRKPRSCRSLLATSRPQLWAPALAAGILAVVLVWPAVRRDEDVLKPKGPESVWILRRRSGEPGVQAWAGEPFGVGDRIQLSWSASQPAFVAVVGEESSGAASVLFPAEGDASVPLPAGSRPLGDSFILNEDAARGRLWIFTALERFQVEPLLEELRRGPDEVRRRFNGNVHVLELKGTPRSP